MSDMVLRVAAKAVIVHNHRILVLREASSYDEGTKGGLYQLPGGRINVGEPLLASLKREVKEETGMTAIKVQDPVLASEWFPVIKGVPHHIVGIFFACTSSSAAVVLSQEHDNFLWLAKDEIAKCNIVMPDKLAVEKLAKAL